MSVAAQLTTTCAPENVTLPLLAAIVSTVLPPDASTKSPVPATTASLNVRTSDTPTPMFVAPSCGAVDTSSGGVVSAGGATVPESGLT